MRLLIAQLNLLLPGMGSFLLGGSKKKRTESELEQTKAALHEAETALQRIRDDYRSIFENALEGIFRSTPDGYYLSVNPALACIYGYESPQELMSQVTNISHQLYVDPQTRTRFIELMQEHGYVTSFEAQIYRKDGTTIWISETAHAIHNDDGSIRYYEGFVRNITKRKHAEKLLREREERHRALLNALPDTILLVSADGTILNYKAGKGITDVLLLDEPTNHTIREALPLTFAEPVMRNIQAALDTNEMQVFEYQLTDEVTVRDYEARIVTSSDTEVLIIIRDITSRKQSDRLKNEFVSIVSHELRTPLTSIRGSLSLIVNSVAGELPPQVQAMLNIAYKNSERLVGLVNDILDIEKIESGKMDFSLKPLNLVEQAVQAIEANRAYGEQYGVTFALHYDDDDIDTIRVNADGNRLLQVFTNLLSNAAKFSPRDSTVDVTITRHQSNVRVAIHDYGDGIPEEFQSRIFQKFAQADSSATRRKGGTGLGLSITRAIIEKMDGTIWFETTIGAGTTFIFELPIWEVVVDTGQQQPRILICEDTPDLASLLSIVLSHGGFSTDIAYNTSQARQLLAYNQYEAMTLDILMPGQDGISFIRELRADEQTRNLPIVVVSALAQQGRQELEGGAFGIVDWLDKPIDQQRLIQSLKQALKQRTGEKVHILHIEDDYDVINVIAAILKDVATVAHACTIEEARHQLQEHQFDLLILDVGLPDGSGLEVFSYMNTTQHRAIPIVIFSAREVSQDIAQKVSAALVKSRTSNQELLNTIISLTRRAHR